MLGVTVLLEHLRLWLIAALTLLVLWRFSVRNARKRERESNEWLTKKDAAEQEELAIKLAAELLSNEWTFIRNYYSQFEDGEKLFARFSRRDSGGGYSIDIFVEENNPAFETLKRLQQGTEVTFLPLPPDRLGKYSGPLAYVRFTTSKVVSMDR